MQFKFLLFPAALYASAEAQAQTFMSVEQAQAALFPGATLTPADFTLSEVEVDELIRVSNATVHRSRVKVWKASTGGWFVLDQVFGRDDRITYAIALDDAGAVTGIEILICAPGYEGVREVLWRDQFVGADYKNESTLPSRISNISGTTLSVEHITEGVRRVLATYALFIAPRYAQKTG
ncbi:MAG: FMN-binding protein [Rhodospirillaceae bacterium]|nr:FMN-binding protein [Rhodospirillaceae bacterium]